MADTREGLEEFDGVKNTISHWCDARHIKTVAKAKDYTVAKCTGCGASFVHTYDGDEKIDTFYYDFDYEAYYTAYASQDIFNLVNTAQILLRYKTPKSILDIGSGLGTFISSLYTLNRGIAFTACEINQYAVRYLQKLPNTTVLQMPVEQLPTDVQYEAVSFIHSLEHFRDPLRELAKARAMLTDDGVMIIQVPAHRSPLFLKKLLTTGYRKTMLSFYDYKAHHIYGFTPNALKLLLDRAGFTILDFRVGRYFYRYHRFIDNTPLMLQPLAALLLSIADVVAHRFGIGGMTVVCKKK